jgi:hypothetical protein
VAQIKVAAQHSKAKSLSGERCVRERELEGEVRRKSDDGQRREALGKNIDQMKKVV